MKLQDGKIRRETIKAIVYHEEQVKMFSNGNTVHDLELQHFHERKIESLMAARDSRQERYTMTVNRATPAELSAMLAHCTGGGEYYRANGVTPVMVTEGIELLREKAAAHWLVSDLACHAFMIVMEGHGKPWPFPIDKADPKFSYYPERITDRGCFQIWKLKKILRRRRSWCRWPGRPRSAADGEALLTCVMDSGLPPVFIQRYSYTDFPLDEIKMYAAYENGHIIVCLPSER